MASLFNQKLMENRGKSGHSLWRSHKAHPHVKLKADNNQEINIKASQAVTLKKQKVTAHVKATGQYSNILSGGSVDIPIRSGTGFGHVNKTTIRMDVRNDTGSALQMISDAGLWINYIEIVDEQGSIIQNIHGKQCLYEMTDIYDYISWECLSKIRGGNQYWNQHNYELANGETDTLYLEIIPFFLSTCNIFLPAIQGEWFLRIWFYDSSVTLISGSNVPTMTNLELLIDSDHMTNEEYVDEMKKYMNQSLDFRYVFSVRQPFNMAMAPDSTYDIVLSGLNGVFSELRFAVQPAVQKGNNIKTYYRIKQFEILNNSGVNIIGGSAKTHEESLCIDYAEHYDNDQNKYLKIYRYSFARDPLSYVQEGQLLGFLNFNGRDQLRIQTGPAEVEKVVTITRSAGPGVPTAGNDVLPYNSTAGCKAAPICLEYKSICLFALFPSNTSTSF
eukprot:TRINITY_DN240_c0_g2_i1.p1 TRINITY_DN240_c0_g2~~TRINITY_DN240_c0_g2_i1.p1  ORF type:complete len:445 (-),score=69.71 TRINITY_DN240_c0_g2_i1:495-1829(-)